MSDNVKTEVAHSENSHHLARIGKNMDDVSEKAHLEGTSSRDVALQLVDTSVATNFTHEEEKKTLRRIDAVLVPLMFLSFALQYMDKACLTGSALFGILPDLDLVQV